MQTPRQLLIEKARKYNLKFVGLNNTTLEQRIADFEKNELPARVTTLENVETKNSFVGQPTAQNKVVEEVGANTAIVMNGKNEVRRYTLETHGEDFKELAKQFTFKTPGYTVFFKNVKPAIVCPHCGGRIYGK